METPKTPQLSSVSNTFACSYTIAFLVCLWYNMHKKSEVNTDSATGAEREELPMLTEQAAAARRAYKRKWAQDNPEKVKAQQERYWQRKGEAAAQAEQAQQEPQKKA